jgi:hypothetical protein
MKSINTFLIIIVLGLAVYYFINHNSVVDEENQHKKSINQVSFQQGNSESTNTNKQKKHNTKTNPIDEFDNYLDELAENKDDKQKDTPVDFITAYRDWDYFSNCYTDVEDFSNKKDPLETLAERFELNPRESQTQPTAQQNTYYQHHVETCKSMITLFDNESDDYYLIRQQLRRRYENITPKTEKSKQLAHALEMVQHLKNFRLELSSAHFSKSNLTPDQLNTLNNEISRLTSLLVNVYQGESEDEDLTPEQILQIESYSKQIEEIRFEIASSKVDDNALITAIESKIDGYLNSIDDYLLHVQSPDAFLLLAKQLYKAEYYQKDYSIMTQLKSQTGIYDPYYINILNTIVMPLVACSMDYPCDAESDYILSYCLGLRDSMFNQACGMNLEDFYFNFYIGANQLNDVNNYFNFLVSRYAN